MEGSEFFAFLLRGTYESTIQSTDTWSLSEEPLRSIWRDALLLDGEIRSNVIL